MSDIVGVDDLQSCPAGDIMHGFWRVERNMGAIPHVVPVVEVVHVVVMKKGHDS